MSPQMPTKLQGGNAPAALQGIRRLAVTSFWLSLLAFVLFGLRYVVSAALGSAPSAVTNSTVALIAALVLFALSPVASISAIVTGIVALVRARPYQSPQHVRTALAAWGVALGAIGLVTLCCVVSAIQLNSVCSAGC